MQGLLLGTAPILFLKEDKSVTASPIGIGLLDLAVAPTTETNPKLLERSNGH
jgi:hypothetical protein